MVRDGEKPFLLKAYNHIKNIIYVPIYIAT